MTAARPTVAVFRPDDDRLADATSLLCDLGVEPLADPMLAIEPTGDLPTPAADYLILTSKTGADLLARADWEPANATEIVAIGSATATALEARGIAVDTVPEEYSSAGLVAHLEDAVEGTHVAVARSDHGSDRLLAGLRRAGAAVEETILYRLTRPPSAGKSVTAAAEGRLAGALFTSSLTVQHFLEAATAREERRPALAGLDEAVVGAIGEPTRETAVAAGITVDVLPETASFSALARETVDRIGN